MEAAPARWRCPGDDRFCSRQFEDDLVVFDETSGHTHLLAAPIARIFLQLRESPVPLGALALVHDKREPDESGLRAVLEILESLNERGLVERIAP